MPNPQDNKYAATTWTNEVFIDVTVPSGQLCQVRRPGLEGLIRLGLIDKFDGLTSMVDQKHIKRVKGQKIIDEKTLMQDPHALAGALQNIDKIIEYIVVQPKLVRPVKLESDDEGNTNEVPLSEDEFVAGVLYTSMVEIQDRMFLFQYAVGGSKDLEKFRGRLNELDSGVDTV